MNTNLQLARMSETRLVVLDLVRDGMPARRIAVELHVSRPAVWRHLSICRELGLVVGPEGEVWRVEPLGDALLNAVRRLQMAREPVMLSPLEAKALLLLISKA